MNQASHATRPFLTAIGGFAAILLTPAHSWATDQPALRCGYTLDYAEFHRRAARTFVIVTSSTVAMLAFALAGDSELVRRLAKVCLATSARRPVSEFAGRTAAEALRALVLNSQLEIARKAKVPRRC